MTTRLIILAGQSNTLGMDGGGCASPGLPIANIPYFRNLGKENANRNLVDTTVTNIKITATTLPSMGLECQMCLDLQAGGWGSDSIIVVKSSQSGTRLLEWQPTAAEKYYDTMRIGCLAVTSQIGRGGFAAYLVWNQGEAECNNSSEASAWAANFATMHTALCAWLGVRARKIIVRVRDIMPGSFTSTVRSQQASVADDLINRDDTAVDTLGTYGGVPNVHDLCSAQNTIGSRVAAAMLAAG